MKEDFDARFDGRSVGEYGDEWRAQSRRQTEATAREFFFQNVKKQLHALAANEVRRSVHVVLVFQFQLVWTPRDPDCLGVGTFGTLHKWTVRRCIDTTIT